MTKTEPRFEYSQNTAEETAAQVPVADDSPLARMIAEENARRAARLAAWNH